MPRVFTNRRSAGVQLARALKRARISKPLVVLGLPRGGVPVAFEVARALHAPLDVLVVRKIGMPGQPEVAIGALAAGDIVVRQPGGPALSGPVFERLAEEERVELMRRERTYRSTTVPLALAGRTVVLVDDGLATGATMLAAVRAAREAGAAKIVAAAPVASDEAVALVGGEADEIEVLTIPTPFESVGSWYQHFEQVTDAEVCALLEAHSEVARNRREPCSGSAPYAK